MIAYFRMEASETSTTCPVEVSMTCRRTVVGTQRAQWMIFLTNVDDFKRLITNSLTLKYSRKTTLYIFRKSFSLVFGWLAVE